MCAEAFFKDPLGYYTIDKTNNVSDCKEFYERETPFRDNYKTIFKLIPNETNVPAPEHSGDEICIVSLSMSSAILIFAIYLKYNLHQIVLRMGQVHDRINLEVDQ